VISQILGVKKFITYAQIAKWFKLNLISQMLSVKNFTTYAQLPSLGWIIVDEFVALAYYFSFVNVSNTFKRVGILNDPLMLSTHFVAKSRSIPIAVI
jgi:hypothetical protein